VPVRVAESLDGEVLADGYDVAAGAAGVGEAGGGHGGDRKGFDPNNLRT
jgi:hypothetical protein